MASASAGRFLRFAALTALISCLAVGAFNLVVDPFGIYRIVDRPGFNDYKFEAYVRVRLVKAYAVRQIRPRGIVLGSSRSHIGISTTHPGWDPAAQPRYNLGLDGATAHEMYAYLRHAQAMRPLRQVVLGLDPWHLGTSPSDVKPGFDEALLDVPGELSRHVMSRIAELGILFNADTAMASVRTLRTQEERVPDWYAPDGQQLGEVYFRLGGNEFVTKGPGTYFADRDREEVGYAVPPAQPHRATPDPPADRNSLDYVRDIIGFCRANRIDLRIFIPPIHAHETEIFFATGRWPFVELGRRALVRLVADDAAANPGARPFPVWDFSGYSSVTTEAVPPPGSKREMAYFWDPSHFKERVGNWVLDRLFGIVEPGDPAPEDFGTKLTLDNIDSVLAKIRADHARYDTDHPADAALIAALAAQQRASSGSR